MLDGCLEDIDASISCLLARRISSERRGEIRNDYSSGQATTPDKYDEGTLATNLNASLKIEEIPQNVDV